MIELSSGVETYNVNEITLGEYLNILNSVSDGNVSEVVGGIMKSRFPDLPKHIAEMLFLKLWSHSTGNVCIEREYTIDDNIVIVPINMDLVSVSENKPEHELFYDITGNIIKFRYPRLFEDNDYVDMIFNCMESISVNDSIIKIDELTDVELGELVEMIDETRFKEICDMLLEPEVYLIYSIGDENKVLTGFKDIFSLVS